MVREFSGATPGVVLHRPQITNYPIGADPITERDLDVTYENTTGRPLVVYATVMCGRGQVDGQAFVRTQIGDPGLATIGNAGLHNLGQIEEALFIATFVVPARYFYRIQEVAAMPDDVTLEYWTEVRL